MPTFSLIEIKQYAQQGLFRMTQRALTEAQVEFYLDMESVAEVLQSLSELDFHSTGISHQTGKPFDVYIKRLYSPAYQKHMNAYIKLQIVRQLIVISFHTTL